MRKIIRIICLCAAVFFAIGAIASIQQKAASDTITFSIGACIVFAILYFLLSKKKGGSDKKPEERRVAEQRIPADYCAFDLETTGLSTQSARIIQIAAVRVHNGSIIGTFENFVNPGKKIPASATKVNGITDDMVENAPPINEVLSNFLNFCGGDILIAHNADRFDAPILKAEAIRSGLTFDNQILDSLTIAKECFPGLRSYNLQSVCEHIGSPVRNAHNALDDSLGVCKIVEAARSKGF